MSMTFMNQLSIIPAVLVTVACVLVIRNVVTENARRRLLLFVLGLGVLLNGARYVTMRYITEPYNQPFFNLSTLLAPSLLGLMALALVNVKAISGMRRGARIMAILLILMMGGLYGLIWSNQFGLEYMILPGTLVLAIAWSLGKRFARIVPVFGLLSMAIYIYLNWLITHPPDYAGSPYPQFLGILNFLVYYITPSLSMVVSALLIAESFDSVGEGMRPDPAGVFKLGLAVALVIGLAYTIFWGSVWDNTSDGLFGLFALEPSALVAIGAGMVMSLALKGRQRFAGLLFIALVSLILYQSFESGWAVSYHAITESRSDHIARALDKFYDREGSYPETLDELSPRDLLFVQGPVILAGETWCYESGEDYYRLSALYREAFSMPVSLRVYESVGDVPLSPPICEERLAEMKKKYPSPMEDPTLMQPPIPTPLPEVEVGLPKTDIYPLLNGSMAMPGSWSPDGMYFFFGTQRSGYMQLHFLIGETGEVCTVDQQFARVEGMRENHAWLPGGRLLYAETSGILTVLTPCQPGAEKLTGHLPDTLDQISAYSAESERVLLNDKHAYWILDGSTLESQLIPDVTPNPYDLHWDHFAWLPGESQLVISRLNGRKGSNSGATLFLVDGTTGEVQNTLDLEGEFGQGAPWVEGLIDSQVLIHSQGELLIADFNLQPVKVTNVLEDIFGLDINYPDDVSAAGSHVNSDGSGYYLSVRLNHPHNQSMYLYDSRTRQRYVYDHEYHTLLLFPDGYSMEMPKLETVPSYRDVYDIVMVDDPEAVQPTMKFSGHTPRDYPHLSIVYLMQRSQLAVASAHGVSLVALSDGEMLNYWSLIGEGYSPWIIASPDGSALIASKDVGGLYYIPLP